MGWQMKNPDNREEKALVFAPNTLLLLRVKTFVKCTFVKY